MLPMLATAASSQSNFTLDLIHHGPQDTFQRNTTFPPLPASEDPVAKYWTPNERASLVLLAEKAQKSGTVPDFWVFGERP